MCVLYDMVFGEGRQEGRHIMAQLSRQKFNIFIMN